MNNVFQSGDNQPSIFENTAKPLELKSLNSLKRSEIAANQRAYQSSVVDGYSADLAVAARGLHNSSSSSVLISKTRREADPWWEIDFGRPQHLHALSFLISTGIQQRLPVTVLLLSRPVGFEDPFLDSVRTSSACVGSKEFTIRESPVSQVLNICSLKFAQYCFTVFCCCSWSRSVGRYLRIQCVTVFAFKYAEFSHCSFQSSR